MAIRKLIRNFIFDERIRKDLVFSDTTKIRLNTENEANPKLQLKLDILGEYPTDVDIHVKTGLITPNSLKKWLKFEVRVVEDKATRKLPAGTDVKFKVRTTGSDYWWDGSAWSVAGVSDWSSEIDLLTNLVTFPIATVGDKGFGLILNLSTTDKTITPEVIEAELLGEFDIDFLEDLIYDGVIRKLNTEFRSTSVLHFPTTSSISSLDLNGVSQFERKKGYNITGIQSVYNLTDDPLKLTNLVSGYAPGATKPDGFTFEPGTITFTGPVPATKTLEIVFKYVPEFYIRQGQDFFEVPSYPSIVFTAISTVDDQFFTIRDTNSIEDFIRDKVTFTAIQQIAPRQRNVRFEYSLFTGSQLDQIRLGNDMNQFFANNKFVKSFGLDCEYATDIVQEIDTSPNEKSGDSTDTNIAQGSFEVKGVLFYDKPANEVPLTLRMFIDTNKHGISIEHPDAP